ncbi:MAG: C25 family cysteine peptidase [Pirellulales bacterium]
MLSRRTPSCGLVLLLGLLASSAIGQPPAEPTPATPSNQTALSDQGTPPDPAAPSTQPDAIDTVVICCRQWRSELQAWGELRREQGHAIHWLEPDTAEQLDANLKSLAQQHPNLRYVVIVGDVPMTAERQFHQIPTHYIAAQVTHRWGSTRHIASDTPYADNDGDGTPELAIGRIPAGTTTELRQIVAKVLDYERNKDFGLWRRQINLTAGTGNFGPLIDGAIEMAAKQFITQKIPAAYETDLCYANWRSPYCPPMSALRTTALEQLQGGAAAWVYMGHGLPDRLGTPGPDGKPCWVLTPDEVRQLHRCPQPPIALILACYAAAYDARSDSVAEQLLKAPGGPVAVIGGTRVTMPYGLSLLSLGLLEHWFEHPAPTVGDLVLSAKRELVHPDQDDPSTKWLDALAQLFHPQRDQLAAERLEHAHLVQLLGDPLLTLTHPAELELQASGEASPGTTVIVRGQASFDGEATVELVCRRDRLTFDPPARRSWPDLEGDAALALATRERANDRRWNSIALPVAAGPFEVRLTVPESAHGPGHVRVFLQGADRCAAAAIPLEVAETAPKESPRTAQLPADDATTAGSR